MSAHEALFSSRLQAAAKERLDALLSTHGVEHGSAEWRALGDSACAVDAFLAGKRPRKVPKAAAAAAGRKKRKARPWVDPGTGLLKTADDAERACTTALQ
jgi:hypothetical protein